MFLLPHNLFVYLLIYLHPNSSLLNYIEDCGYSSNTQQCTYRDNLRQVKSHESRIPRYDNTKDIVYRGIAMYIPIPTDLPVSFQSDPIIKNSKRKHANVSQYITPHPRSTIEPKQTKLLIRLGGWYYTGCSSAPFPSLPLPLSLIIRSRSLVSRVHISQYPS